MRAMEAELENARKDASASNTAACSGRPSWNGRSLKPRRRRTPDQPNHRRSEPVAGRKYNADHGPLKTAPPCPRPARPCARRGARHERCATGGRAPPTMAPPMPMFPGMPRSSMIAAAGVGAGRAADDGRRAHRRVTRAGAGARVEELHARHRSRRTCGVIPRALTALLGIRPFAESTMRSHPAKRRRRRPRSPLESRKTQGPLAPSG